MHLGLVLQIIIQQMPLVIKHPWLLNIRKISEFAGLLVSRQSAAGRTIFLFQEEKMKLSATCCHNIVAEKDQKKEEEKRKKRKEKETTLLQKKSKSLNSGFYQRWQGVVAKHFPFYNLKKKTHTHTIPSGGCLEPWPVVPPYPPPLGEILGKIVKDGKRHIYSPV